MRALSFVAPARPDSAIDALIVLMARHSAVASVYAEADSGNGVPSPVGRVTRGVPHAATHPSRQSTAPRRASPIYLYAGAPVAHFLFDLGAVDRVAVSRQRALPRGDGIGEPLLLEPQVAQMILNGGALGKLRGRL